MGRYYTGDIEGKFWSGVQDSLDASFFGGSHSEPNFVDFCFSRDDDMESVREGIESCVEHLGKYKAKLDDFFGRNHGYSDKQLSEGLKLTEAKVAELLKWYARLGLGRKIEKCLSDSGQCEFQAEL